MPVYPLSFCDYYQSSHTQFTDFFKKIALLPKNPEHNEHPVTSAVIDTASLLNPPIKLTNTATAFFKFKIQC